MAVEDRAVTQKQFARLLDVSPGYITELKQAERLVLNEKGKVLVDASRARIRETADPAKDGVRARHAEQRGAGAGDLDGGDVEVTYLANDPVSLRRARAIADKAEAEARRALREEQVELGQLLQADEVEQAVRAAVGTLRNGLENMPAILAPQVAAEADEAKCRVLITDAIEHALEELARQFTAIAKAGVA